MRCAVSTADQLEIQELVSRYNVAIDRSDVDGWLACFTEDGSFQGVAGRYEGIAKARHLPNVERPEAFNRIMLSWLAANR